MDGHQVICLTPRLREPPFQEFVEGLHVLHPPVLSRPHFAQITPEFDKAGVPFRLLTLLPRQNLVDLGQNEQGPLVVELGQHGRIPSK